MSDALAAVGLGKRYGTSWGLRDCTLALPEGRVAALVGPNGSGKSTLLRMAAGFVRPSTGTVTVFGEPAGLANPAALARVGYLDQERPLYRQFRIEEILALGRRLNPRWDDAGARAALAELEIPLRKRVGQLSIGQRAQVALVLCMAKRPDLLLLDEPVAALDPLARHRLMQVLMETVADRGTTVFLSSHVISELEAVCDHVVILAGNRVQLTAGIEELLARHLILIGPRGQEIGFPEVEAVISARHTGRQTMLLVRTVPDQVPEGWRVVEPSLEEVVLAYLAEPGAMLGTALGLGEGAP